MLMLLSVFFQGSFALCTFAGEGFKDGQAILEGFFGFSPHSQGHRWEL